MSVAPPAFGCVRTSFILQQRRSKRGSRQSSNIPECSMANMRVGLLCIQETGKTCGPYQILATQIWALGRVISEGLGGRRIIDIPKLSQGLLKQKAVFNSQSSIKPATSNGLWGISEHIQACNSLPRKLNPSQDPSSFVAHFFGAFSRQPHGHLRVCRCEHVISWIACYNHALRSSAREPRHRAQVASLV